MLVIYHPPTYQSERSYIFKTLFADFLGVEYKLQQEERTSVRIVRDAKDIRAGESARELVLNDKLFQTPAEAWLSAGSLPQLPLEWAHVPELKRLLGQDSVPVIFGQRLPNGSYWERADFSRRLGIDVFGSAFFMLTRYEELVRPERDEHERFMAKSSIAFRAGFLHRPIVNEYVEILWAVLSELWPDLQRKPRSFHAYFSHDVDWIYGVAKSSGMRVLKQTLADVLRRGEIGVAWRRAVSFVRVALGSVERDFYNTFDFIMSLSEQAGSKSAFYFITSHTGVGDIDGDYHLEEPYVRRLLRRIDHRGHEVGLHTSYETFRDNDKIQSEFQQLRQVAQAEGIVQSEWGGRQHYLRFEVPTTWQGWEAAGLTYDSTLGYADSVGYRAGVCYSYHPYDLRRRQMLQLRERPLIVMDGSLFDPQYMGLTIPQARTAVLDLIAQCRRYQGEFTLLWHNSSLVAKRHRKFYKEVVESCRDTPILG